MFWNRNRAVGVDIGEGSVKAVEVERNGHALKIVRTGVRSLPPTLSPRDAEGIGAFLREFFADCGFRSDRVYLGIPRHQAILRTLRIPPADEPETQQMVRFQSRKVLPMNGEGLRIGFIVREGEGDKSAVIVAAKEDVYRAYVEAVSLAGLRPAGVTLSSFGTANAYLNAYHEGAPGVVVDIGARMTEITLAAYGRFAASRQASLGVEGLIHRLSEEAGLSRAASSQAIRGARLGPDAPPGIADWAREVASEVDRTLRAFSTDGLPAPERVLLTGGGGQVGGLAPFLSEQIGVPVEAFKKDAGVSGWPSNASNPGAQFVPALGYLLGDFAGLGTRFDFGADFFSKADAKPRPTRKYLLVATAVAALFAGWLVPDHYLSGTEEGLKSREEDVGKREKTATEAVEKLRKKLDDLRSWTWKGPSWIDVMREITLAVPESKEVYLTQVQFRAGGEPLRILGRAVNEDAVNRFVGKLTRSKLVWLVERRNIQQHRDRKERHHWDFELKGFLVEPEEEVGP